MKPGIRQITAATFSGIMFAVASRRSHATR